MLPRVAPYPLLDRGIVRHLDDVIAKVCLIRSPQLLNCSLGMILLLPARFLHACWQPAQSRHVSASIVPITHKQMETNLPIDLIQTHAIILNAYASASISCCFYPSWYITGLRESCITRLPADRRLTRLSNEYHTSRCNASIHYDLQVCKLLTRPVHVA